MSRLAWSFQPPRPLKGLTAPFRVDQGRWWPPGEVRRRRRPRGVSASRAVPFPGRAAPPLVPRAGPAWDKTRAGFRPRHRLAAASFRRRRPLSHGAVLRALLAPAGRPGRMPGRLRDVYPPLGRAFPASADVDPAPGSVHGGSRIGGGPASPEPGQPAVPPQSAGPPAREDRTRRRPRGTSGFAAFPLPSWGRARPRSRRTPSWDGGLHRAPLPESGGGGGPCPLARTCGPGDAPRAVSRAADERGPYPPARRRQPVPSRPPRAGVPHGHRAPEARAVGTGFHENARRLSVRGLPCVLAR